MPLEANKPIEVDPEKIFFIDPKLADVTCCSFDDLMRINQQDTIAFKYINLLRKSLALEYGTKFKNNFEIVQCLLGKFLFLAHVGSSLVTR